MESFIQHKSFRTWPSTKATLKKATNPYVSTGRLEAAASALLRFMLKRNSRNVGSDRVISHSCSAIKTAVSNAYKTLAMRSIQKAASCYDTVWLVETTHRPTTEKRIPPPLKSLTERACVFIPRRRIVCRVSCPPPPSLPKVINKSNFVFNAKVRLLYNFPKIGIITSKQYLLLLRAHLLADSIDSDQCLMRLQYSIVIGKKMIGNEQKWNWSNGFS